jgi:hypothetical protein
MEKNQNEETANCKVQRQPKKKNGGAEKAIKKQVRMVLLSSFSLLQGCRFCTPPQMRSSIFIIIMVKRSRSCDYDFLRFFQLCDHAITIFLRLCQLAIMRLRSFLNYASFAIMRPITIFLLVVSMI